MAVMLHEHLGILDYRNSTDCFMYFTDIFQILLKKKVFSWYLTDWMTRNNVNSQLLI